MLNVPEHEMLECKQSLAEAREVVVSVAAFASAHGGMIQIGVTPEGHRSGVQLGRTTLEQLANQIKENTDPPQYPSITYDGPEESAVITVRIDESPIKPVWAFYTPYKRVGRSNQKLSPEETQRLTSISAGRTWDVIPNPELRIQHLERKAINRFLQASSQSTRSSIESVLENLGLLTSAGIGNGAALLFAKNPQRFVPDAQVKCARFLGIDAVQFLDEQTLNGNLLTQTDEALAFVQRNTQQAIRITGRAAREVIPEYPEAAVREAIVNAICHRDYTASGTVQLRIYDDRLEIWSPGVLPSDLTVEALYKEHPSHPRYRYLADVLYRARIIEKWGTGTLRIVQACLERGMPQPEFISEMGTFIVRFKKSPVHLQLIHAMGLNKRQTAAVSYVADNGRITSGQYRRLFAVSERHARNELNTLVEQRVFVRTGNGPATHYVIQAFSEGEIQQSSFFVVDERSDATRT